MTKMKDYDIFLQCYTTRKKLETSIDECNITIKTLPYLAIR